MIDIAQWNLFIDEFSKKILPIYIKHESSFDVVGIHGCLHISRAIIFSEVMSRLYISELNIDSKKIDIFAIRFAVSFHDSGRQGNGIDIWEKDSANLCNEYLLRNKEITDDYRKYISNLIEKKGKWDSNKKIVHDADVLEIMRPCCGHGGINGFKTTALRFLSNRDDLIDTLQINKYDSIRSNLIKEAWSFILFTENNKYKFINNKKDILHILIEYLLSNSHYCLLRKYIG